MLMGLCKFTSSSCCFTVCNKLLQITISQIYTVSKKHTNFGELCLQGAWIKIVQFCCKASEHFPKLCPCLRLHFRSSYLGLCSWLSTMQQFKVSISVHNALPDAARTPVGCTIFLFSQLQQPVATTLYPPFVWKLCHKLPSIISLLFIQNFSQNFGFLAEQSHRLQSDV